MLSKLWRISQQQSLLHFSSQPPPSLSFFGCYLCCLSPFFLAVHADVVFWLFISHSIQSVEFQSQTPSCRFKRRLQHLLWLGFFSVTKTRVFGGTGKWLFPLPSCLGVAVTHSRLITDELRKKRRRRRWRRGGRGGDTALSCGFFELCFSSCNKMCQRCDDHVLGNIITKNVAIFQIHDSIWFIVFFSALTVMPFLDLHLDL